MNAKSDALPLPAADFSRHGAPRLSLVLPAYNEESCIVQAVREARTALPAIVDRFEILVVDDGSRDSTSARVERAFAGDEAVRVIRHPVNQGYGAALRTGFSAARGELIAFTDADCQFFVEDLGLLLEALPGRDVVCGYRVDRKDSRLRLLYSRIYNRLVRGLIGLPVRDLDCALKVFRRPVLEGLVIEGNGFLVNTEVLSWALGRGAKIAEVGVRHRPRAGGESTVSPLHALPVLYDLVRFWWSHTVFPVATLREAEAALPPADPSYSEGAPSAS